MAGVRLELLSCGQVVDSFEPAPPPPGQQWTELIWYPQSAVADGYSCWPSWWSFRVKLDGQAVDVIPVRSKPTGPCPVLGRCGKPCGDEASCAALAARIDGVNPRPAAA